ncbi:MAG: STAS-like domain-containing protein [Bacillota bacterium]
MKLSLGKWGNHLNSRRLGQEIRFLLSDELKKGRRVEVDLKDVMTASPGFCIEAFAKLNLYVPETGFKSCVKFSNANDEVRTVIQHAVHPLHYEEMGKKTGIGI